MAAETNHSSLAGLDRLVVSLDTACHSRCNFCQFPAHVPARTVFDDAYFELIAREVRAGREAGIQEFGLTGMDPLTYPRAVDVVRLARDLGYGFGEVRTTGLPLTDRALVKALVEALPPRRLVQVPLYGPNAAIHDAVTGVPGGFERVLEGLHNLLELLPPHEVLLMGVVLKTNQGHLAELVKLGRSLGLRPQLHLVFPNTGEAGDPYLDLAPRLTEVARELAAIQPPLTMAELYPCLVQRTQPRPQGNPPPAKGVDRQLRGQSRRVDRFPGWQGPSWLRAPTLVRCPRAQECRLAGQCRQEIYAAYAGVYGLEEFQPVT